MLMKCGTYTAISTAFLPVTYFFYDGADNLVGMEERGKGGIFCTAYDPSFVKRDECAPLDGTCQ
jgi:hypothetical protein